MQIVSKLKNTNCIWCKQSQRQQQLMMRAKLARGRTFSGDYLNGVLSVVGSGLASQARRIVINNQNPFKIAHAIWLRPDQTWRGPTEQEQQEDMHEVDALMRRHRQHQRLVKCVGSGWQVGRAGEGKGSRIMLSFDSPIGNLCICLRHLSWQPCMSCLPPCLCVYRWYDNWHEAIIHLDTFTLTIVYIAISVSGSPTCLPPCISCACMLRIKYNLHFQFATGQGQRRGTWNVNVDEEEPHDDEDILNNNELQLPGESRNSCVMRADAQILSSSLPSPSMTWCPVPADYAHLTALLFSYSLSTPFVCFLCFVLCRQLQLASHITSDSQVELVAC